MLTVQTSLRWLAFCGRKGARSPRMSVQVLTAGFGDVVMNVGAEASVVVRTEIGRTWGLSCPMHACDFQRIDKGSHLSARHPPAGVPS